MRRSIVRERPQAVLEVAWLQHDRQQRDAPECSDYFGRGAPYDVAVDVSSAEKVFGVWEFEARSGPPASNPDDVAGYIAGLTEIFATT
jgi:hypothetical protein